jgi:hypothetical protein
MQTHCLGLQPPNMDPITPDAAKWLESKLKKLDTMERLGLLPRKTGNQRRYVFRLVAQGKCLRCRRKHTTGKYYCPLCVKFRTASTRKYRRNRGARIERQMKALIALSNKLKKQLASAEYRLQKERCNGYCRRK